ncbi:hypothetical protein AWB80_06195 [Caballeronia pedi]|uniref:Uncharacterized protein n=1 Tax=Caballeronia pedi TaxID=1777141 RepID=A0A158D2K6_9BURK|nr:hypothetical protein [Caballeronia pedi]SAK88842.1 hypothetical protein AWB80_06195 [Caballeronia pedi]
MEFENDPTSRFIFLPGFTIEYHWTARLARALVGFYQRNWQFLWATSIAVITAYIGYLAIPHG